MKTLKQGETRVLRPISGRKPAASLTRKSGFVRALERANSEEFLPPFYRALLKETRRKKKSKPAVH